MKSRRLIWCPRDLESIVAVRMGLVKGRRNVRFGSEADMCTANPDVRYGPIADIAPAELKWQLRYASLHWREGPI